MLAYLQFPSWLRPEIIPGLPIRWYGMMYLVGFALTYLLFMYQVRERGLDIDSETVSNFFFWSIIGVLLGGRLFATLLFDETGTYWRHPWLIFWPFANGRFVGLSGMNFYGGLLGPIVAWIIYARVKKIDLLDWGDMIAVGAPLGYTFGRMGNFINGELFGRVTTAPWGIVFPHAQSFPVTEPWVQQKAAVIGMALPAQGLVNLPRHPTMLYEALWEGVILWLIMWFLFRRSRPFRGFAIAMFLVLYGAMRFVIDYFRMPIESDFFIRLTSIDNPPYLLQTPFNFLKSQVFSLAMVIAGALFIRLRGRAERPGAPPGDADESGGPRSARSLRKRLARR